MNPSQIKNFGSINHSENNNNDHSKEPSTNNQFEGHEEYDCSEMGERTPLLKQRYISLYCFSLKNNLMFFLKGLKIVILILF